MNGEVSDISATAVTPATYLGELFAVSWRHGGEITAAVSFVIAVVFAVLGMRSWLHLQDLSGPWFVLLVLLPPVVAVLLLETGVAAWRLHRRQRVALATKQTLLDLNAGDRAELERSLLARYRRRERRIGERNEARVERLNNEIAALSVPAHDEQRQSLRPLPAPPLTPFPEMQRIPEVLQHSVVEENGGTAR